MAWDYRSKEMQIIHERMPAHLGTDLGTEHRETASNKCDVLQPAGRFNRVDLHF
jgi:hypothetical protein